MEEPTKLVPLGQKIALMKEIEVLNLSRRSFNCLKRAGINCVYDVMTRNTEDLLSIRNLGRKCLIEIETKLQQYVEANSISPVESFSSTAQPESLSESPSIMRVGTQTSIAAKPLQLSIEKTNDTALSTSELLEMALIQAVQYPPLTPERWGDFVAECKAQGNIGGDGLDNISIYGRTLVPLDQKFVSRLSSRTRHALERAGVYDLEMASRMRVRDLVAIRQIGRNATIELFRLIKSELPNLTTSAVNDRWTELRRHWTMSCSRADSTLRFLCTD